MWLFISTDAEEDFDKIQHLFLIKKNTNENRNWWILPYHDKIYKP